MSFYQSWSNSDANIQTEYINNFLNKTDESLETLLNGTDEDIKYAIKLLLSTPVELFIKNLTLFESKIETCMIPQFSNFEHALKSVAIIIESTDNDLGFKELGEQIMDSKKDGAKVKYGENQAKLALECSFVYFEKINNKTIVKLTSLGRVITCLKYETVLELSRRLLLRNEIIKTIIFNSLNKKINYEDLASCLSQSTLQRRKSNVKFIVTNILKDTQYEYALNNISWGRSKRN